VHAHHTVVGAEAAAVIAERIDDGLHHLTAGWVRQGGDSGGHRGDGQSRRDPRTENPRPS
jgi:hypothetical protein